MPRKTLRAVVFDCDGILVDTEPLHYEAFQRVLVPLGLGHDFKHYMEAFIGFDDRDAFLHAFKEAGRELDPLTLHSLVEAKGFALQNLIEKGVPTFPGVVELVRELAAEGVPLAVASGAMRHEIVAFVKSLGLEGLFSVIVAADEVRRSKPDPETYVCAVERLKSVHGWSSHDARSCIAVEDTPAGIYSAKSAGLFVIGVTNSFSANQLREADHVVPSLSGLSPSAMAMLLK
ncbi:MAG: HAD family phosphatase [Desulfobacteraceae bacterium]|nr:HAD family phosphatase [Desulfobacteraceae bacterium]